jgi:hypothetical protein
MVVSAPGNDRWLSMHSGEIGFTDGVMRHETWQSTLLFLAEDLRHAD